jgi:thioredoxin 1
MMNLNNANFEEKVTQSDSPVLVDFWAAWCGPCTMLSPIVEQLAEEHPEISFGKVNVDEAPELAQRFQVSAIPTLVLFKDGKAVDMSVGVKSKDDLEEFIK